MVYMNGLIRTCLLLAIASGLHGCSLWEGRLRGDELSKITAQPGQTSLDCPENPQGTLLASNVTDIALSDQGTVKSGQVKAGQNIGYSFSAAARQRLSFNFKEDICFWIFTPSNQILKTDELPEAGKYTIQISVAKGITTFRIEMRLDDPIAAIAEAEPEVEVENSLGTGSTSPAQRKPSKPSSSIETYRVQFDVGSVRESLSSAINPAQRHQYLLWSRAGQEMTIRVERGDIKVKIISPNSQTIGVIDRQGNYWQGRLPNSGDYILDVSANQDSSYEISVEII
jgi:hypothetical protein